MGIGFCSQSRFNSFTASSGSSLDLRMNTDAPERLQSITQGKGSRIVADNYCSAVQFRLYCGRSIQWRLRHSQYESTRQTITVDSTDVSTCPEDRSFFRVLALTGGFPSGFP